MVYQKISLPRNLSKMQAERYFDRLDYEYEPISVRPIKNAVLTNGGAVFRRGFPVFDSHYIYWRIYIFHILIGYGSCIKNKRHCLDNLRIFSSGQTAWGTNYFHWITEGLPRLYRALEVEPELVAIAPNCPRMQHVFSESIKLIGFNASVTFPPSSYLKIPNFLLASCPAHEAAYDVEALQSISRRIKENLGLFDAGRSWRNVFVSRSRSRGRFIINEDEVRNLLIRYEFDIVYFEDMDFAEQVSLMSQTSVMITIHGAGLTNLIFMPEESAVVEILPDPEKTKRFIKFRRSWLASPMFARLASIFNVAYFALISAPAGVPNAELPDLHVDLVDLESLLLSAIDAQR